MPNKAAAVADESIEAPERRVTFLEWSRRGACRRPPVLGLGQLLQNLPPETGGIALGTASTGNTLLPALALCHPALGGAAAAWRVAANTIAAALISLSLLKAILLPRQVMQELLAPKASAQVETRCPLSGAYRRCGHKARRQALPAPSKAQGRPEVCGHSPGQTKDRLKGRVGGDEWGGDEGEAGAGAVVCSSHTPPILLPYSSHTPPILLLYSS